MFFCHCVIYLEMVFSWNMEHLAARPLITSVVSASCYFLNKDFIHCRSTFIVCAICLSLTSCTKNKQLWDDENQMSPGIYYLIHKWTFHVTLMLNQSADDVLTLGCNVGSSNTSVLCCTGPDSWAVNMTIKEKTTNM